MLEIDDVEEDYFIPSNSASLANIFGEPSTLSSEKASLKYVPPRTVSKPEDRNTSECIFACSMNAFEWFNNVYTPRGKVGFAIVKTSKQGIANILLYDSNKSTLSCATIQATFEVKMKDDTYLSYYDNARKYWSIYGTPDDTKSIMKALESFNCKIGVSDLEEKGPPEPVQMELQTTQKQTDSPHKEIDSDSFSKIKTKETILNRMASMGQSVLPPPQTMKTDKTSDSSDIDDTYEHNKVVRNKNIKTSFKKAVDKGPMGFTRTQAISRTETECPSHSSLPDMQLLPSVKTDTISNFNAAYDLNQLMTEQRLNNSEWRLNMGRLTDKMDQLLEKINSIKQIEKSPNEIQFQNNIYKKLLEEYENKIKDYEEVIKAKGLCSEIHLITSKTQESMTDCKDNKDEVKNLRAQIISLENSNKHKDLEIARILHEQRVIREQYSKEIETLQQQLEQDKLYHENETLKIINQLEESKKVKSHKEIEDEIISNKTEKTIPDLEIRVKNIMNDTYQSLAANFDSNEKYLGSAIKSTTATVIKELTLEALKELKFK